MMIRAVLHGHYYEMRRRGNVGHNRHIKAIRLVDITYITIILQLQLSSFKGGSQKLMGYQVGDTGGNLPEQTKTRLIRGW